MRKLESQKLPYHRLNRSVWGGHFRPESGAHFYWFTENWNRMCDDCNCASESLRKPIKNMNPSCNFELLRMKKEKRIKASACALRSRLTTNKQNIIYQTVATVWMCSARSSTMDSNFLLPDKRLQTEIKFSSTQRKRWKKRKKRRLKRFVDLLFVATLVDGSLRRMPQKKLKMFTLYDASFAGLFLETFEASEDTSSFFILSCHAMRCHIAVRLYHITFPIFYRIELKLFQSNSCLPILHE